MGDTRPTSTSPGHIAVAVIHEDPPRVLLARDEHALSRVVAVEVVCAEDPGSLDAGALDEIQTALLDGDWATAVARWIEATGVRVDVHPDEPVVDPDTLTADAAAFDIRLSRLFER